MNRFIENGGIELEDSDQLSNDELLTPEELTEHDKKESADGQEE